MSYLYVAYYTLLKNIRNWKFILLFIVAPLLIFAVSVNATTGFEQRVKVEKVKTAYYLADDGMLAKQFEQFLQSSEIESSFDIQKVDSLETGNKLVRSGKVETLIYMDKDFSNSIAQGKKTNIELHSSKDISLTKVMLEDFINTVNASIVISNIIGENSPDKVASYNKPDETFSSNGISQPSSGIEQIAVSRTGKILANSAKYSYIGGLNMLVLGALLGCFSVLANIKMNTQLRYIVSPINRFAQVGGMWLGNTLTLFVSSFIVMGYTYFVVGEYSGAKMLIILLTFILFSAMITAIGMLAGYITKKTSLSVLIVVSIIIFFGGAANVVAMEPASSFLKWVIYLSPQYYTYSIVTDTIMENGASVIQSSLISMTMFTSALVALTLFLGRRKPI